MVDSSMKRHAVAYSAVREYRLHNFRFDKAAFVFVQVTYRPDAGKNYTVLERHGSPKLIEIIEKLLSSEVEADRPTKVADHEISTTNYEVCLRGTETMAGRSCYVIDLVPKRKSKYLIRGTAWVDRISYGVVRLDGATSASVSIWVGAPRIKQEFSEIDGIWVPTHTRAVSSGMFLGASELEIRFMDYLVTDLDHSVPSRAAETVQERRP